MSCTPRFLLKCACLGFSIGVLALVPSASISQTPSVRYLSYAEVCDTIELFAGSGLPGSEITTPSAWDVWIRKQDRQVRERIDRGVEDSISNLILYGTSYTSLPRLPASDSSITATGELSEDTRARVHAMATALQSASHVERVEFARQFLLRKGIAPPQREAFLTQNLKRFAQEQREYQQKLEQAGKAADPAEVLLTRGTLYQSRGLSVDTSLLPNFAIEDTLRAMLRKGALVPGKIRRIAIIGPGLDFTDKRDGYDFYPLQTLQPFAVLEAVQGLAPAAARDTIEVVTFDLNPAVNAHVALVAKNSKAGRPYVVQLPRDTNAEWSAPAIAYWEHFGEILGTPAKPLPVPPALGGVTLRAVSIAPKYASRVAPVDLNVVTQTVDLPAGEGFDLMIATNVLVYYDRLQQAVAMANIARLLNPGGIFLCNSVLPAQHDPQLAFLGRRTVTYSEARAYGDDVVAYQKH